MKKGVILLAVMAILFLNLSGCWDYSELTEREVVTGVGIDKREGRNGLSLTIQTIVPEKIGTPVKAPTEANKSVQVITTEGSSMSEAISRYNQTSFKSPFFQNNRIYIIGEKLAREGIGDIVNYLSRSLEHRTSAFIIICKGKASDILNWKTNYTSIPSDYIFNLVNYKNFFIPVSTKDLHAVMMDLSSEISSPYTSALELVNEKKVLNYFGTAVFKKDKLAGWLGREETNGLLWITNKFGKALMETNDEGDEIKKLTCRIVKSKTKITPEKVDGTIKMIVDIKMAAMLLEYNGSGNVSSPDFISTLEKKLEDKVKRDTLACLEKVRKEYKTDILMFGEKIHKKYPEDWEKMKMNWDETYPEIDAEINAKVTLSGTGKVLNPVLPHGS